MPSFLEELERLLLWEATQEPHEGDLVGKAKPVMRANELVDRVQRFYPLCRTQVVRPKASGHDLVINATPAGAAGDDELPAPIGRLDPGTIVFDIVPKPAVTRLMAYAKEAGCEVIGGASMIEAQADAILEFLALEKREVG